MKNGLRAFDSDMHVYDPAFLYEKYMNPKWGERIPRGQEKRQAWARGIPARRRNQAASDYQMSSITARSKSLTVTALPWSEIMTPCPKCRRWIWKDWTLAVLFRTSPLHCDDSFEAEYANDLCRAWNSWIADFCKENPSRLKASALITLHDVDLAIEEVRRVVNELEVTALSLCPEPVNGKRIHDRYYDPLWAEIEKLGVALCFHPPARPKQDQVANKFFGHPNANIVALALRNPVELILAFPVSAPAAYWKNSRI